MKPYIKSAVFICFLLNLVLGLNSSEFPTLKGHLWSSSQQSNMPIALARVALCASPKTLLRNLGMVEHSTRLWNSPPSVLRWALCALWYLCLSQRERLRCWSQSKTLVITFPQFGFLTWHPNMRRENEALNSCASCVSQRERKFIRARRSDYTNWHCFAETRKKSFVIKFET